MREALAVSLSNVAVSYPMGRKLRAPRFPALRDVSVRIAHGDRLGIVGRNGSGKSTLLRVVADLLLPDSGSVVRNHGACQLLSLNLGFLPHLTGRQNAILGGLLQGFDRQLVESRLASIHSFSELGEFFDVPFGTYSAGMRARLGMALALELEQDILLIDEILGVGDAAFQEKSRRAILDRMHSGVTVVLVSHSEQTVRNVCTHALWIEEGRSVMYGNVADVLDAYRQSSTQAKS